ncbi:late embryogenesis abundant protein [Striga asiatica]|uniref:Late embryogenesis abundant protein n=1 Tax=Striga asiatica TaxID=4170 RepID=A0A5A7P699_STRAF|nr:late embryogenesis abundant protein [Striga asiatica]
MNLFTLEEATILLPDADNDELPPVKTLFPENITRINKKQMQKRVILMNPNSNQAPEARSEQKNPNSNKKFKRHGQFFIGEKLQRNGEVEQSRRGRAEPARWPQDDVGGRAEPTKSSAEIGGRTEVEPARSCESERDFSAQWDFSSR